MKKLLLIIFILLWSINASGTTYFISANTGSDANTGLSWAQAWLTLVKTDNVADGDTVVIVGTFSGQWSPGDNDTIVLIDSLRYTDGINTTVPDTSWSAIVERAAILGSRLADSEIIGIDFYDDEATDNYSVEILSDDTLTFKQCRFRAKDAASSTRLVFLNAANSHFIFESCLFLSTGQESGIYHFNSGGMAVVNCTFISTDGSGFSVDPMVFSWTSNAMNILFKIRNNIVVNEHATREAFRVGNTNFTNVDSFDINHNLFYVPNHTKEAVWRGTDILTTSVWQDTVNNHDADGGTNDTFENPALKAVTTSAYILKTSPAYNAGANLGLGLSKGYFQYEILNDFFIRRRGIKR